MKNKSHHSAVPQKGKGNIRENATVAAQRSRRITSSPHPIIPIPINAGPPSHPPKWKKRRGVPEGFVEAGTAVADSFTGGPLSLDRPLPAPAIRTGEYDRNNRRYKKGQMYGQNRARQFQYADLQPWERQPDETPEAYQQFCTFRDMDPLTRSYGALSQVSGHSKTVITRHGSNHHWQERAAAWDFHLERSRLEQTEKFQLEMAHRHALIAKKMLARVEQKLEKLNFNKLSPKEVAQWLDIGVKVERLSRGMKSDEAVRQLNIINQSIDARHLSDDQILAELKKLGQTTSLAMSDKVLDAATV